MAKKAKVAKGNGKKRGKAPKLTEAQQEQRAKYLVLDAVKVEDVLYSAKGKNVREWLRSDGVRPMLRQDWYWIYADDRAPDAVETFLYSRGFRRHSAKPAYVHSGTCKVKGYGDETKYEASSAFGAV
jgi:hypothetical protein